MVGLLLVGVLFGVTLAASHDSSVLSNTFVIANYETAATETFSSPSGWKTCDTVEKLITVKNKSDADVAVRIRLEEDWLAADGVTHLPLVSDASGNTMAIINFTYNSGWTRDGGYYYYDTNLASNATTSSLLTGVTLNCDANLDTSDNSPATSDGIYSDATYHLNVSVETVQANATDSWKVLYNEVASRTKGILSNMKLSYLPSVTNGSGDGVFTYAQSIGSNYPVYYYRGSTQNDNSVIFADYCWRVLRTTDTGGVKLIYTGVPTGTGDNRQCPENATSAVSGYFNNVSYHASSALYMYGDDDPALNSAQTVDLSSENEYIAFHKGPHLSNGIYTFDDTITGQYKDIKERVLSDGYRYYCIGDCSRVGVVSLLTMNQRRFTYYEITGYETPRALLDASLLRNENSSLAKQMVEEWFENNLIDYEDKLEDTVFCIDRDPWALTDRPINNYNSNDDYKYYSYSQNDSSYAYSGVYVKPSLECAYKNDSFTKNDSSIGNGALDYSVGLITLDEATLTGSLRTGSYYGSSYYNASGSRLWTMTPALFGFSGGNGYPVDISGNVAYENYPKSSYGYNPVISLKPGTRYTKGTGAYTDPFIVE